jgi:hypothetical protein
MSVARLQTQRPPKPPITRFLWSIGIGERRLRKLKGECHDQPTVSRRVFNRASLIALMAAVAGTSFGGAAQRQTPSKTSTRRNVIKQELPGEPPRDLTLVEVSYPPAAGSPAHRHANGVMAFVVSGAVASKVGDGREQTFHAGRCLVGTSGRGASGLTQCKVH